jgi:putative transposase
VTSRPRICPLQTGDSVQLETGVDTCAAVLRNAIHTAAGSTPEMLVVDGGCENYSSAVDELVNEHLLHRLRAQSTELRFSNSPIEAFWSSLKHQWLYDNHLDSEATVRKLVAFFVYSHNAELPHSAFSGQTPDEMYNGTGAAIAQDLATARGDARAARLAVNRARSCATCPRSREPAADDPAA